MSVITNLALQDQVVIGGEEIAVFKWTLSNVSFHQIGCALSRLQLAVLECDSNNSTGQMIPHDAEGIFAEWRRVKLEWARALKWRHLAPASQEKILSVLAVTDNEALRTVNVKCRRLVDAVATLIHKIVYSDSAKLQYGVGPADERKLAEQIAYVEEILIDYIGTGELKDGKWDTGMEVAAFEHLGVVNPPINLHQAQVQEASPGAPDIPAKDAPDTASTVPAPGTNTQPGK